jgi:hypothetical protein
MTALVVSIENLSDMQEHPYRALSRFENSALSAAAALSMKSSAWD